MALPRTERSAIIYLSQPIIQRLAGRGQRQGWGRMLDQMYEVQPAGEQTTADLTVRSGHILALRLFDVGNAIDLRRAEALWLGQAAGSRLAARPQRAAACGLPLLGLALDPVMLTFGGRTFEVGVTARLYAFGAVTLALRVPVADCGWAEYVRMVNAFARCVGPDSGGAPWYGLLSGLCGVLVDAVDHPAAAILEEDYLLGVVHEFDTRLTADELMASVDLVPLLSGEQRALSEATRAELLRNRFSYYADDLVVLAWDRAFLYEPRGGSDVAAVLEIVNVQLLEMRYYDELLDAELPRFYDMVEATCRRLSVFALRRYSRLDRRLFTLVAEVTELTDRVENALQATEDAYLARICDAALDLFRVKTVSASVDRKLGIIRDIGASLFDEAATRRAELLEATLLLLTVVDMLKLLQ